MRKVTIEYNEDGMYVEDCDGQWVSVTYDGDKALFSSKLLDDEEAQHGSCHREDAEIQALWLVGVPKQ